MMDYQQLAHRPFPIDEEFNFSDCKMESRQAVDDWPSESSKTMDYSALSNEQRIKPFVLGLSEHRTQIQSPFLQSMPHLNHGDERMIR